MEIAAAIAIMLDDQRSLSDRIMFYCTVVNATADQVPQLTRDTMLAAGKPMIIARLEKMIALVPEFTNNDVTIAKDIDYTINDIKCSDFDPYKAPLQARKALFDTTSPHYEIAKKIKQAAAALTSLNSTDDFDTRVAAITPAFHVSQAALKEDFKVSQFYNLVKDIQLNTLLDTARSALSNYIRNLIVVPKSLEEYENLVILYDKLKILKEKDYNDMNSDTVAFQTERNNVHIKLCEFEINFEAFVHFDINSIDLNYQGLSSILDVVPEGYTVAKLLTLSYTHKYANAIWAKFSNFVNAVLEDVESLKTLKPGGEKEAEYEARFKNFWTGLGTETIDFSKFDDTPVITKAGFPKVTQGFNPA